MEYTIFKICYHNFSKPPRDPSTLVNKEDKLQYINYKLNYINKVIQPFFSQRTINNDQQQVSRKKLIFG